MISLTTLPVLPYPAIDPVLLQIGPVAIRWYALAYIAGLCGGWRYVVWLNRGPGALMERKDVDDLLFWVTIGVILGGRIGSVLFYNPAYYLAHPLEIFAIWRGGMAFHGGLLGVVVVIILFARQRKIPLLSLADMIAAATPIGLFFGRIANFINGELYGRVTDVPWAMVFPTGGPLPRHPSQLYEAALEGLVLFLLLFWLVQRRRIFERPGFATGVFLLGYGLARGTVELLREPDAHIGLLAGGSTMGQLLSIPMLLLGLYLIWRARTSPPSAS